MKILIVDDSTIARVFVKRCLNIVGFKDVKYFEASNGQEALDKLNSEPVDLVFADLGMPVMDGETLLKKMKASPKYNSIPMIIISSKSNPVGDQGLIRENAYAVLQKPVSLPALNQVIQPFLDQ